jgi:hypothetical protein
MSKPIIAVERGGIRYYVILEWSPPNRTALAIETDRDAAFAAAGKARIDFDAPPVVDRTGGA